MPLAHFRSVCQNLFRFTVSSGLFIGSLIVLRATESISLSGADWKIHEDAQGDGAARKLFDADSSSPGWTAASVPGNIQGDVAAAHLLKKPLWYGPVNKALYEVARKDWWYRKDFSVPSEYSGKRVTLNFDGVDEHCKIWLNGRLIGENRGMFRRFWFDVTAIIKPGEINRLGVQIFRMPETLVPYLIGADGPESGGGPAAPYWFIHGNNLMRQTLTDLKTTGVWSYDFAANVWTLGIWKDVRLDATGPMRIDWTRVETILDDDVVQPVETPTPQHAGVVTESRANNAYSRATVRATLEVDSATNGYSRVNFRIHGPNTEVKHTVEATLTQGVNLIKADMILDRPQLWWPHTHGTQPLYTLDAEVLPMDGGPAHASSSTRFGVRQIRWVHTDSKPDPEYLKRNYYTAAEYESSKYQLVLNGQPIRALGSSIVLSDVLPATGGARNAQLLRLAKEGGLNLMRLNGIGGGPLMDESWYRLADELGIMVTYEFPIGNSMPEDDAQLVKNVEVTLRSLVKQSRNHPSIIQYIGGNEMGWSRKQDSLPLQMMQKVTAEESDRLFRATDPEPDNKHGPWWFDLLQSKDSYTYLDGHFRFDELKSRNGYRYYNSTESDTMWYGEFGSNSPANLEVWHREAPLKSQWPLDDVMNDTTLTYHNAVRAACDIPWLHTWLFKPRIDAAFGAIDNLAEFISAGQYYGAEGLRYAFDALRRKGTRIGGMTNHDFGEPWPNLAGSYLVDYDGRPLMNYDFVKQAMAPISLSLQFDSVMYTPASGIQAELFLVSDAPSVATGLRAKWIARDSKGALISRGETTASIAPLEVKSLGNISLPALREDAGNVLIELQLEDAAGKRLVERVQILGRADLPAPFAGLMGNAPHPIRRTTLTVTPTALRLDGDYEVLELDVKNTGRMTALFCEPHPLVVYRTDLSMENRNCSIPPGESRVITIRAPRQSRCGLSLAHTGWRLSAWNADSVTVAPGAEVMLAVGRWDSMSREFAGYFDVKLLSKHNNVINTGNYPDAANLAYRLSGSERTQFQFSGGKSVSTRGARLRLHTADQSDSGPTTVQVTVNGRTLEKTLPQGLGLQRNDPAHRAFPVTLEFDLASSDLRDAINTLSVEVKGNGWFSWDAIDLVGKG